MELQDRPQAGAEAVASSPEKTAVSLGGVDITFHLANGGRYQAVKGIELEVSPGEFVSIVGPTGCGKSTLLNAAAGLLSPSAGKVGIFGKPLAGLNRRAGYLFQQDALMPWKPVEANVALGLRHPELGAEFRRILASYR